MTLQISSPQDVFKVMKEKAGDESLFELFRYVLEQELHYRPSVMTAHHTEDEIHQTFTFFMTGKLSDIIRKRIVGQYKDAGWAQVVFKQWTREEFDLIKWQTPPQLNLLRGYTQTHVFSVTLQTTLKVLIAT